MNSRFANEEYKVENPPPPKSLDVLASGVQVAKLHQNGPVFYLQEFNQNRFFVLDMIEGVRQHLNRSGFIIDYVLWDKEYERFEFNTTKKVGEDAGE